MGKTSSEKVATTTNPGEEDHVVSSVTSEETTSHTSLPKHIYIDHESEKASMPEAKKLTASKKTRKLMLKSLKKKGEPDVVLPNKSVEKAKLSEATKKKLESEARMRFNLGVVNFKAGDLESAEANLTKSLESRLSLHDVPDHIDVALVHDKLGDIALEREDYDKVKLHYDSAIPVLRSSRDPKMKTLAGVICMKKGNVLMKKKERDDALECFRSSTRLMYNSEENEGDVSQTFIKMGYLCLGKGDSENALKFFSEAMTYSSSAEEHSIWYIIALINLRKGEYDSALTDFERVLMMKRAILGEKHPDVATVLRHIGFIHFSRDNFDDALKFYEEALLIMTENEFDLVESFTVCSYIEDIYTKQGQLAQVLRWYKVLLSMTKKGLGQNHNEVAKILHKLGNIYVSMGSDELAIKSFMKEGKIRSKNGGDPVRAVMILFRVATIYRSKGAFDDALTFYEEAIDKLLSVNDDDVNGSTVVVPEHYDLDICEKPKQCEEWLLMQDHQRPGDNKYISVFRREVGDALNDMGNIYVGRKLYQAAIACYESSLRIKSKVRSEIDEQLKTTFNLGRALFQMDLFEKSRKCLEIVLRFQKEKGSLEKSVEEMTRSQKKQYRRNQVEVASTLDMLGKVCFKEKNYVNAMEYYLDAYGIRKQVLGEDHPIVGKSLHGMALVFYNRCQYKDAQRLCKNALEVYDRAQLESCHILVKEAGMTMENIDVKLSKNSNTL